MQTKKTSKQVFINPNFRNTHINPNFLKVQIPSSIHINPAFLNRMQGTHLSEENVHTPTKHQTKIIAKSRTKLIREPAPKLVSTTTTIKSPLIKIGSKKLVRASFVQSSTKKSTVLSTKLIPVSAVTKRYKIDRRVSRKDPAKDLPIRKKSFVSKYALSRVNRSQTLTVKRVVLTKTAGLNKKLEFLNINGVLYKSTRNKLQKTERNTQEASSDKTIKDRIIFVRGHKFVLDKSGYNLTRVPTFSVDGIKLKRIDIGGFTYVAKSSNVFIRTDTHKTRSHLSFAKQKSINMLSKNLVKSNIPCPIFRRVGKCATFERGKCPKAHDKKQIAICTKFLKGECTAEKCLLSHDVNLSKMPTCKFFLQGCCIRIDCPYLHKKLNEKAGICLDFIKGYCKLAEKCNKRHEFLCPDFESIGKCARKKCPYFHKKEKEEKRRENNKRLSSKNNEKCSEPIDKTNSRYFGDERKCNLNDENSFKEISCVTKPKPTENLIPASTTVEDDIILRRPKLGDLPAFIPL